MGWYWYMGLEIQTTYSYGYNTSGTVYLDGQVHRLAMLKSAQMFLSSERYTALVTEGIGGIEMKMQWDYLNTEIRRLEDAVKGWSPINTGLIA